MSKRLVVLLFGMSWPGCLQAQLDLLTLREAESIVERIPAFAAAKSRGECPWLSAGYWKTDQFLFQARGGCGPTGGMLIDNYILDRRTGVATTAGDVPVDVGSPEGRAFARQLVRQAQNRILSANEARCLALEAARALPNWSDEGAFISVEVLQTSAHDTMHFTARRRSLIRAADSWRTLSVDSTTARVRDDETGLDLISEGLGSLIAKILALRDPPWLTDEDAITIALQVPSVVAELRDGCRLSAVGALRSDETQVGLSCGGHQVRNGIVVEVNLRTGQATDATTGKPLESADAGRLAHQLLEGIRTRESDLRRAVDAVCHMGEAPAQ